MPDITEVGRFIELLFCHANGEHWISLRAFRHHEGTPPLFMEGVKLCAPDLAERIRQCIATTANHRKAAVFAPPVATFTSRYSATMKDLAEGPVLSVECDEQAVAARLRLSELLGLLTAKRLAIFRPCKISLLSVTSFRSDHLLRRIMVLAR